MRRAILIDVIEGEIPASCGDWLAGQGPPWCDPVEIVSIDPFEAYRSGLKPYLAHAVVVADPFHIVSQRS